MKIRTLANNPERWPLADEAESLNLDLCVVLYGRGRQVYRVLFTIDGDIVNIHRVRRAAQDWLTEADIYDTFGPFSLLLKLLVEECDQGLLGSLGVLPLEAVAGAFERQ